MSFPIMVLPLTFNDEKHVTALFNVVVPDTCNNDEDVTIPIPTFPS